MSDVVDGPGGPSELHELMRRYCQVAALLPAPETLLDVAEPGAMASATVVLAELGRMKAAIDRFLGAAAAGHGCQSQPNTCSPAPTR